MVNMYSMGMMNYGNNLGMSNGNIHQSYKTKYGVGYEDFGTRPYAQPYPQAIVPRHPERPFPKTWIGKLLYRYFQ